MERRAKSAYGKPATLSPLPACSWGAGAIRRRDRIFACLTFACGTSACSFTLWPNACWTKACCDHCLRSHLLAVFFACEEYACGCHLLVRHLFVAAHTILKVKVTQTLPLPFTDC